MRYEKTIRSYEFINNEDEPCVYNKIQGSVITFIALYVNDILLIENDVCILSSMKVLVSRNFSKKDWREIAYIFGRRLYRDRSRRLLTLSQFIY